MLLNLPVSSYDVPPDSTARLVNCHPELQPAGATSPVKLLRSPGTSSWTTVGSGPIGGMYRAKIDFGSGPIDRLYVVSDRQLYSVDSSKTATLLGVVGTPTRLSFAHNDGNLVVVNEPNAYYWDGTTFAEIDDPNFTSRGAGDVVFLENYLLFREPNSNVVFGADLGEVNDFLGLDFVQVNTSPDDLVGLFTDHRNLVAFCDNTTEMFSNSPIGSGFAFERNVNATMQVGLADASLVGRVFDVVFWVADDLTVRRLDGNVPTKVSTPYIEQKLREVTISSGETWGYITPGHYFIGFTFLEGTYVFDMATNEWFERESYRKSFYRPRFMQRFANKTLAGDRDSNAIVELSTSVYSDALTDRRRVPRFSAWNGPISRCTPRAVTRSTTGSRSSSTRATASRRARVPTR